MLRPENFKKLWTEGEDRLVSFPQELIDELLISKDEKIFLVEAGLPEEASPFLTFGQTTKEFLAPVNKVWGLPDDYNRYRIIGSNVSGDPICIDQLTYGAVVYLNHDMQFKSVLINSSVIYLAESLLAYRELVNEAIRINGAEAYMDGDIPIVLLDKTVKTIQQIDKEAFVEGSFWYDTLNSIT